LTSPALPPGQIETKRFPVTGERVPAGLDDLSQWRVEVTGLVDRPLSLDIESLVALDSRELVFDIHCVTSWTRFNGPWEGVPLAEILAKTGVDPRAGFVSFEAYSDHDHHTSLPLDVARDNSWLVHAFEGEPLSVDHGGPVRVVTPGRYFYKSLKWVKRIVLLEEDRLGWWETNSAYHNNGDPTSGLERFTSGSLRPAQVARFMAAPRYDKYRGRVMSGLDLRKWKPASLDLHGLQLKNCDLRGLALAGADLRGTNLSSSDLRDADLRNADMSGSDLEGANFIGADLRGADLSNSALTATRFTGPDGSALIDGVNLEGVWGLLEDQESYVEQPR
jgi:DMSO/TMAO reductase YedYZ molybdopterin-dependent catalytic subunit